MIKSLNDVILLVTLAFPIRIDSVTGQVRNERFHRTFCTWTFTSLLIAFLLSLCPRIIYIFYTRLGPPSLLKTWIDGGRIAAVGIAWLVASCIRRGPKRHYDPHVVAGAFGLAKEDKVADDVPNVLDWTNCSYLSLMTVFYVSLLLPLMP